ncbi:hypothetical protein JD844_008445 [Phrynosoma platyrhinos]|uniref:Ciliogenesis and planar polarity effector 1 n=1 Tax=Phrynosoma platyrhinos TaxID=52577 RepID=A0ABQ7TEH3_PHRPL|nr:hypothetical protein JD844_008445 [Phrynosoma platyrhinos]
MTCLGELLTLVTYGCSVEFGPAEFIPLHPLIMYRSHDSLLQDSNHSCDSSASERDLMRQRFSITSHPSLPYLIASDGYIITVLRFSDSFSPSAYMRSLLLDSSQRLEKLHYTLISSKEYNEESQDDNLIHSQSFISKKGQKVDTSIYDKGRLEFATMFDTIHAVDECNGEKDDQSLELDYIQKNLIAAWRVGISRSIQERDKLLSFTIRCIAHFFSILQYAKLSFVHFDNPVKNLPWIQCVLKCFQQFLTVLIWDSKHRQTLGHLMKFTLQTLKLMLAEPQDHMFFSNLLGGFSLLKMVSHCLNGKNTPQYAILPTELAMNNMVALDSIVESLFQTMDWSNHQNFCALDSILNLPLPAVNLRNNPEKRLIIMWRLLYKHVLWYWAQFNRKEQNSIKPITEMQMTNERPMIEALATHIQAILQSSGEKLEHKLSLSSVTGEEQFLTGSYEESIEAWEKAIQETKIKGGKKMPFLQTRYYLAILYCHLYHYSLSEAQGLCDHLVNELLKRSQISVTERNDTSDTEWMVRDIHTEAALAVVQSLARFMAAYFTNEPLYILPPHCVDILPPLHIKPDRFVRVVPLKHSIVTAAVRDLGLSCVWTVEYALDLLLVGGLIPESVWLAHKLGDWKMAVSIGVSYDLYCQSNNGFPRSEKAELYLPLYLTPTQIFQEKLQSFLGQSINSETSNNQDPKYKQLTDSIEEEDARILFSSVEEILKAAVMAEADILSGTFQHLVDFAKDLSKRKDKTNDILEEETIPFEDQEQQIDIIAIDARDNGPGQETQMDDSPIFIDSSKTGVEECKRIEFNACVIENSLSALEWACRMLPFARFMNIEELVQDMILSLTGELPPIKKVAEILVKVFPNPEDVRVPLRDKYNALHQRLRHCIVKGPNSEEMMSVVIQAAHKVNVTTLKRVMRNIGPPQRNIWEPPEMETQDPGVCCCDRFSLGTSLSRSTVSDVENSLAYNDAETADSFSESLQIDDIRKHILFQMEEGCKVAGVVVKKARGGIWRKEIEKKEDLAQESEVEGANVGRQNNHHPRLQFPSLFQEDSWLAWELHSHSGELTGCNKNAEKLEDISVKGRSKIKENSKDLSTNPVLPVVGEWEFERDDDEYIKFLELFLTYILEKDLISNRDSSVPFLVSFSALLREQELNSFLFDVHTTVKRRQIRIKGKNVFRAGSCYSLVFEPTNSKLVSLCEKKKKDSKKQTLPVPIQQPIEFYNHDSVIRPATRIGLFGRSQQLINGVHVSSKKIHLTPTLTQHSPEQTSVPQRTPVHKYIYKAIKMNDDVQREEPTPEMKFKFKNVAHLLEWMIRWSDKRLLYDPITTVPYHDCRPMMHVKTSTSAILASMWLLEEYYSSRSEDRSICIWKAHIQSSSTHSAAIKSKLKKESSVDTGYSPSVETPAVIQDGHAYGDPCESAPGTLPERHSEKKENHFKDLSETYDLEIEGKYVDAHLTESVRNVVDMTFENEDLDEPQSGQGKERQGIALLDNLKHQVSGTARGRLQLLSQLVGQPLFAILQELSISDIEYTQEEPLMETLEQNFTKMESTLSDYQPSFTAVSSTLSNEPVVQEKEETAAKESTVQPLSTSDAVRQMLQDEMFKLVQLQQINFMSLMQVVGSSFASLPNLSQQTHQTQSFQLGRSQASNAGGTDIESSPHRHPADGFPKTEMPPLENHWTVHMENTGTHGKNDLCNQNHNETILNPPHIGDSSHLPESQSNGARLIPPFQSLHPQVPARPLPLLSISLNDDKKPKLIPMAKPVNSTDEFPLLKLNPNYEFQPFNICSIKTPKTFIDRHVQQRQFWGPPPFVKSPQGLSALEHKNGLPTHLNLNSYDLEGITQAQEQKNNWAGLMSKTSRHLYLNEDERKENMSHSQKFHVRLRAEKPVTDNEIPVPKTYENFAQFPLLYLKSCSQTKHPSVPVKITGKDTDSRDLCQAKLPLLYAKLPPLIKFQTPKLIPLQDLIAFQQSRQTVHISHVKCKDHPEKIQLLKADITTHEARQDKNNEKRSTMDWELGKKALGNQADFSYDLNDGNILLNPETVISSAGLHYLASVRKTGTDLQETGTNTDTVLKSHQNIQTNLEEVVDESSKNQPIIFASVSTSVTGLQPPEETQSASEEVPFELSKKEEITRVSPSVKDVLPFCVPQTLPPEHALNLTVSAEGTKQTLPFSSDMTGQKYINVIDIEDGDFMKNLPDISESAPKQITRQAMKAEFPTSAELHHMAASVTNLIPPNEFDREGDTLHTESVQIPPETIETDVLSDPLTVDLLHEDFSTTYSRRLSTRKISKEHISSKLQEMDRQLLTLQNVAERMEKEFRNTELVVEAVEEVGLVTDPRNNGISFFAPDVKVSKEEYYSTRVIVEDFTEEEDGLETKSQTSYLALQTPSVSSSVSAANLLRLYSEAKDSL